MGNGQSTEKLQSANSRASNAEDQLRDLRKKDIEKKRLETERLQNVLDVPWRRIIKTEWTEDEVCQLKNEVEANQHPESINFFNILVVGQISAGKSSIINTIESAINKDDLVSNNAQAGTTAKGKSITKQLRRYLIKEARMSFWDTMGLEVGDDGLDINKVSLIMDGKVPRNASLDGTLDPMKLKEQVEIKDRMHCLMFAIHAEKFALLDDDLIEKFAKIRSAANERDIPCLMVCTAVDMVCEHVDKDISKVFHSQKILKMLTMVSEKTGFPLNLIHPQRNYVKETLKETKIDFLIMLLYKQLVKVSKDFCERLLELEDD